MPPKYGDGFDVNAFGDEPTPSDAYAVYGEDLAASDEPAPSEDVMFFSCPCGITLEVHLDCVERCLFVLGLHNDYLKTTSGLCYDLMGIPICSLRSIWVTLGSIPGQIGMSFASAWGQFESSLASVVDYRINSECIYNAVRHMLHHIKNSLDYSRVGFKEYY